MSLAAAPNKRLPQLCIEFVMECGVLFMQLVESRTEFVLLTALAHTHRHDDDRLGEGNLREHDGRGSSGKRVVRVRVLQLGHHTNVTGAQPGHFVTLLPLCYREVAQFLDRIARRVPRLGTVRYGPGPYAKQRHIPHMGFGNGLEYLRDKRIVVFGGYLDRIG